ncbi:sugar transferase [Vibrio splendidus]
MKILNFLFGLVILIILLPFHIIISLFIIRDGGPIFYKQERVGFRDGCFYIYKYRTMVVNADKIGGYSTVNGDHRITKVGCFLRKYSIDELPQCINLLNGTMSLVGPRPNVRAQQSDYDDLDWNKRCSVFPGITGLAQATLRSEANFDQRLALDLEYVDKKSFIFDILIVFKTIKQVVFKGGW